ncbi:MAG: Gfo/Idh/MocA family oxidoreductase, partial [Devosia nanyangense]|nr:Gfo/Idh/MocA family oxidoreductase [Devosia nanyangense]
MAREGDAGGEVGREARGPGGQQGQQRFLGEHQHEDAGGDAEHEGGHHVAGQRRDAAGEREVGAGHQQAADIGGEDDAVIGLAQVIDRDPDALKRMREDIYPKRYSAWDESIELFVSGQEPRGGFDVILIGTPPDVHLPVAVKVLQAESPKVLQIEKPLCPPTLDGLTEFLAEVKKHPETAVIVGFNHLLAENTSTAERLVR